MLPHILAEPLYLQIWILWLIVINTACIFFLREVEARWVLVAWVCSILGMSSLFDSYGYTRLLGLAHIICWTPLLFYLHRRRHGISGDTLYEGWVRTLFVTNVVAVIVDYFDVMRYLLGNRL